MKASRPALVLRVGVVVAVAMLWHGCTSEYSGGGDVDVHGSFYYGVGYGPGFYGPGWYGPPPPVVVAPPPMHPPVGPRPMPPMARPMPR